jgi:hypothetical protein
MHATHISTEILMYINIKLLSTVIGRFSHNGFNSVLDRINLTHMDHFYDIKWADLSHLFYQN